MIFEEYFNNLDKLLDLAEQQNNEKAIKALINEITINNDIQKANIEKCFVINIELTQQEKEEYCKRLHSICKRLFNTLNSKGYQNIVNAIKDKLLEKYSFDF